MRAIAGISALLSLARSLRAAWVDDGIVDVAFIAQPEDLEAKGVQSCGPACARRAVDGLVRLDPRGEVVPGVAERWIVTDGGASYIFRINEFDLAGGNGLTAQAVRDALQRRVRQLQGTPWVSISPRSAISAR